MSIRKLQGVRSKPWRVEVTRDGKTVSATFRSLSEAETFEREIINAAARHKRLVDACDGSPWPGLGIFVRLVICGASAQELLALEWTDVDLANAVIHPRSSTGTARSVQLTGEAPRFLAAWHGVRTSDQRVFAGSDPASPPPLETAWREAQASAALNNLSLSRLKRSCEARLRARGASAPEARSAVAARSVAELADLYVILTAYRPLAELEAALRWEPGA